MEDVYMDYEHSLTAFAPTNLSQLSGRGSGPVTKLYV